MVMRSSGYGKVNSSAHLTGLNFPLGKKKKKAKLVGATGKEEIFTVKKLRVLGL